MSASGQLDFAAYPKDEAEAVEVREVPELSRARLRAHFGQGEAPTLPPPRGLLDQLFLALDNGDGSYR